MQTYTVRRNYGVEHLSSQQDEARLASLDAETLNANFGPVAYVFEAPHYEAAFLETKRRAGKYTEEQFDTFIRDLCDYFGYVVKRKE